MSKGCLHTTPSGWGALKQFALRHMPCPGQLRCLPQIAAVIHMVAGILTFVIVILAIFAMAQPFSRNQAWRRFSKPTLVWACISAAAFLGLNPGIMGDSHFGVFQRVMAVTFLSWMLATAFLAFRHTVPAVSAVRLENAPAVYS